MPALRRVFLAGAASALLSGCIGGIGPIAFKGGSEEWDGYWAGRMTLSIGEDSCPRRSPLSAEISGGALDGAGVYENLDVRFVGSLDKAGVLQDGALKTSKSYYDLEMTGSFEGEKATGVWKNKRCKGKWEMRLIRKS